MKTSKARQEAKRKKINFMIDTQLLEEMENLIPRGERSDFANEAFAEALVRFGRRKAMEKMDAFRKKAKLSMTTEEIIEAINYGRK